MKKKILPVLIVTILIFIIVCIMFIAYLVGKYTPTKERADLAEQYSVTREDEAAIILDQELIETKAKLIGGHVYLDYYYIHDNFNSRFYWDANENILLYTTANELISAPAESNSYLITKSSVDFGRPVVKATSDSAYVDLEFVSIYTDLNFHYYENPSRVVITTQWGNVDTATIKKDTQLRISGGIKSPILADLTKGAKITILETGDNWAKAMTEDGIIGYVRTKMLTGQTTETIESDFVPENFSHITKDFKICMAWHQVTNRTANADIASILQSTKGINVISPTWLYISDNDGNILNLASADYVNYCHEHNIEVWALVTNLVKNIVENDDQISSTYILTHTSSRQNLVNQIVSAAIQYNLDGINLDFESLSPSEVGDAYIQFVRELSLKCANNGLVLSIDNYVPTEYTAFYNRKEQALFADYIVIMGYDEHWAGSEEGSVASIGWVREGVTNTLKSAPASQVILGIPFYNRIWMKTPNSEETPSAEGDDDVYTLYDLDSYACGMNAANNLIAVNGADKIWLEDSGQYYAEYENDGVLYQIWLEDPASVEEKLRVMNENNLAGASFWKLGLEANETWDTVIKYIN